MSRPADPDLAERRRRQILDAAVACFGRRGFHETSMQEICTEAGLSAGAVYRYFPCKADLVAAIVDRGHGGMEACLAEIDRGGDVVESLCSFAADAAAKGEERSSLAAHVISAALQDQTLAQRLAHTRTKVRDQLARTLDTARAKGRVNSGVPCDQAARIIIFLIDGLFVAAAMRSRTDRQSLVRDFREILQRLLGPGPPLPESPVRRSRKRAPALATGADR